MADAGDDVATIKPNAIGTPSIDPVALEIAFGLGPLTAAEQWVSRRNAW